MTSANRVGGRRTPRINHPSVLVLEGRTLLAASPRFAQFPVPNSSATIFATQIVDGTDGDLWSAYGDSIVRTVLPTATESVPGPKSHPRPAKPTAHPKVIRPVVHPKPAAHHPATSA